MVSSTFQALMSCSRMALLRHGLVTGLDVVGADRAARLDELEMEQLQPELRNLVDDNEAQLVALGADLGYAVRTSPLRRRREKGSRASCRDAKRSGASRSA